MEGPLRRCYSREFLRDIRILSLCGVGFREIRSDHQSTFRIEEPKSQVDAVLFGHYPHELPRLELDGVGVDLSAVDLLFRGRRIRQRSDRRPAGYRAEQDREEAEGPERSAMKARRRLDGNRKTAHPVFNLGGFMTRFSLQTSRSLENSGIEKGVLYLIVLGPSCGDSSIRRGRKCGEFRAKLRLVEPERSRRVLHCDMDCFYAAVHQRDDPSLRGKPVVIGGRPESRGVVAAASYEVRRFGVHSAMPSSQARRLCPEAIFIPPDFRRYSRESEKIFAIYRELTPLVQAVSIDEAYLDVTDHLGEAGSATAVAKEIRRRVREERGLTVSVGVGPNRLIAKIASDFEKPDGLTVVRPAKVQAFLDPLPVRRLHSVGPATEKALAEIGVRTVAELRAVPLETLSARFGKHGRILFDFSRGIDDRPVEVHSERKSLGTENTYAEDLTELARMEEEVQRMAVEVAEALARSGLAGCTVTLKLRYSDFTTLTRSRTFAVPVYDGAVIAEVARDLLRRTEATSRPVRLLGVTASNLVRERIAQLSLFV